jgi:hypothetical protein
MKAVPSIAVGGGPAAQTKAGTETAPADFELAHDLKVLAVKADDGGPATSGRTSVTKKNYVSGVTTAGTRLPRIVSQHALDHVEQVDDHIRPALIGEDRANRDYQISRCIIERSLTGLALHSA